MKTYTLFGSNNELEKFEEDIEHEEKSKIDNLINDTLGKEPYTNLFSSLLDTNTYDKPSSYSSKDAQSIIKKLNTIESPEIDPANNI